jgi:hypothetical protein
MTPVQVKRRLPFGYNAARRKRPVRTILRRFSSPEVADVQ